MDGININNLFPSKNGETNRNYDQDRNQPLNIFSLYHPKENKKKMEEKFDIDELLNFKEEKKKKAMEQYKKYFNMCLKKIKMVNKMNKTDILYEIPLKIFREPNYDSIECLTYIDNEIQKLYMDTLIVSNNSIFITWINIKKNREAAKSKKDNKSDKTKKN